VLSFYVTRSSDAKLKYSQLCCVSVPGQMFRNLRVDASSNKSKMRGACSLVFTNTVTKCMLVLVWRGRISLAMEDWRYIVLIINVGV